MSETVGILLVDDNPEDVELTLHAFEGLRRELLNQSPVIRCTEDFAR